MPMFGEKPVEFGLCDGERVERFHGVEDEGRVSRVDSSVGNC